MFSFKFLIGDVHGGVAGDFESKISGLDGLVWRCFSSTVKYCYSYFCSLWLLHITFDAYVRDLAVYWYSNMIAYLEGSDLDLSPDCDDFQEI